MPCCKLRTGNIHRLAMTNLGRILVVVGHSRQGKTQLLVIFHLYGW